MDQYNGLPSIGFWTRLAWWMGRPRSCPQKAPTHPEIWWPLTAANFPSITRWQAARFCDRTHCKTTMVFSLDYLRVDLWRRPRWPTLGVIFTIFSKFYVISPSCLILFSFPPTSNLCLWWLCVVSDSLRLMCVTDVFTSFRFDASTYQHLTFYST